MATRRLTSFLWGQMATPGQSAFEVGRNVIRNAEGYFTHFANWRVAEHQGQTVGALNGYVIPDPILGPLALEATNNRSDFTTGEGGSKFIEALWTISIMIHASYENFN